MRLRSLPAIVLLFILVFNVSFIPSNALSTISSINTVRHTLEVSDFGLLLINETLVITNDLPSLASVPEIKLYYPSQYYDKMFLNLISDTRFNWSFANGGNLTTLSLKPTEEISLNPGENYSLNILLSVEGCTYFKESSLVEVNLVLYPGISLPSKVVESALYTPFATSFQSLEGYELKETPLKTVYSKRFENVTAESYKFMNAKLNLPLTSDMIIVEVPKAERIIKVENDGSISVIDTLQIRNVSNKSVTSIKLDLLNPNAFKAMLLIPIGQEEEVDLGLFKQFTPKAPIEHNHSCTFTIKYSAPADIIKFLNGRYILNVTTSPSISTLVKEYIIRVEPSEGIRLLSKVDKKLFTNASPFVKDNFIVEYEPKLFWSSSTSVPLALMILILLLGAFSYFQKGEEEEKKFYKEFYNLVQDKIQLASSTLDLYEERRLGKVPKQRFNILKQEYVTRTGSLNSTLVKTAGELVKESPDKAAKVEKILNLNRELDQALKALVNNYDLLQTRRISDEVFLKRRSDSAKKLDSIRREIEGEVSAL
ncbi:MAG: hypothetical protein QXJ17_04730 [Nitrososphaeria archaeon]